ncbi:MAG TPA: hypothetical protein VF843_17595 [Streptosporangiaceae bacterium]
MGGGDEGGQDEGGWSRGVQTDEDRASGGSPSGVTACAGGQGATALRASPPGVNEAGPGKLAESPASGPGPR